MFTEYEGGRPAPVEHQRKRSKGLHSIVALVFGIAFIAAVAGLFAVAVLAMLQR